MTNIQLNVGELWELGGERHYLDQVMGSGFLLFRSERTAAPFQIPLDTGEGASPTVDWLTEQFAIGAVRRLDSMLPKTFAQQVAVAREDDFDAIVGKDPRALVRQIVLKSLDRMKGYARSDQGIRRALAAIWAAKPRQLERHQPPSPTTVRRWLDERGCFNARMLKTMISMSGRVPRARRLPITVHRRVHRAAMAYWANAAETIGGAYDLLVGRLAKINRWLEANKLARVPLPSEETFRKHVRHWDLQQLERDVRSDFRERLERVAQHSSQPAVQREARRLLDYGRARARSKAVRILPLRWLSLTEAAAMIGVERGDVRRLVDAGLVTANDGGGGRQRQHSVLQRREVERIKTRIRERMSWRAFCHASGLPKIAIEQMLAADLLRPKDDPLVTELFGDRQLERRSAELLLERARKVSQDDESDWVPLSHAMRGVGGREKPWARVIQAGFDGDLPGGFRCDEATPGMLHLKVHPITARRLIMGGPSALTPFGFRPGDLGEYWRLDLTPGEVELHLNCTAQDVTWLRSRKLIAPNNVKGTPTSYARPDVEALGHEYITTREIAARLDLKAKDVWQSLQGLAVGGAVGQGFYRRDAVETLLEKFERSSRS
ncbi:hypothetical protein [Caulobacter sp. LjRoot300]|uniref:hypothetical protein n=1 Tax=Caulobacter sp. LjRoot300 TaxID=3342321 RepID=UPI003ECF6948